MQVDVKLVRELAKMLDATNLTEIEVADGDRRIRVVRKPAAQHATTYAPPVAAPVAAPAPASAPAAAPEAAPAPAADTANAVKSPMVGTCYLSPEPDAPPFVKVGDSVKAGQTSAHHRGHESHEPDHGACRRHGPGRAGVERPAGRI